MDDDDDSLNLTEENTSSDVIILSGEDDEEEEEEEVVADEEDEENSRQQQTQYDTAPDCILVDEEDTQQLPELTERQNKEDSSSSSVSEEEFMSTTSSHECSSNEQNQNSTVSPTPNNVGASSSNTSSASTASTSSQLSSPINNSVFTTPTIEDENAPIVISREYSRNAIKTLKKPDDILTSSTSSTSISSTSSSALQYTSSGKGNIAPKYNSTRNFDPRAMKLLDDNNDDQEQQQMQNHDEDDNSEEIEVIEIHSDSEEPVIKKTKTVESFNSLSPFTYTKNSCYSISSSIDDDVPAPPSINSFNLSKILTRFNDAKLFYQPKVIVRRMSPQEVLIYKQELKKSNKKKHDDDDIQIINSEKKRAKSRTKRKSSPFTSTDDSNDVYMPTVPKRSKKYTIEDSSGDEQRKTDGGKILMKIFRERNNQYNASVSCSEDDTSTAAAAVPVNKSNSSITITSTSAPVAATKSASHTNTTKTTSRGKNLDLVNKTFIKSNSSAAAVETTKSKSDDVNKKPVELRQTKSNTVVPTMASSLPPPPPSKATVSETKVTKSSFKIPRLNASRENEKKTTTPASTVKAAGSSSTRHHAQAPSSKPATTKTTKQTKPVKKVPNKKLPVPSAVGGRNKITTRSSSIDAKQQQLQQQQSSSTQVVSTTCRPAQLCLEFLYGKIYYNSVDEIQIEMKTFNLINANAYNNRKYDYGFSFMSLNDNEKMHLLKLQRKVQRVYKYEIFSNEINRKFENGDVEVNIGLTINRYLDEEENWITSSLKRLSFNEAIAVLKRFRNLLNAPFRSIDVFDDGSFGNINVKVTFENNRMVCGNDLSVATSCLDILHNKHDDFDWIRQSLNNHTIVHKQPVVVVEKRVNGRVNNLIEKRQMVDDKEFWHEVQIRKAMKKALVKPPVYRLVKNKTIRNYKLRNAKTYPNVPLGRLNLKPRFKLNAPETQPAMSRGSSAIVELFEPIGVPNRQEFESKFAYYSSNYNLNLNYNDIFIAETINNTNTTSVDYNNNYYYNNYNYDNGGEDDDDQEIDYNNIQNYICSP